MLAANRDEHYDRPSVGPRFIPGDPGIVAGLDLRAGGTWLGFNDRGIIAGILNRRMTGAPLPPSQARSRGLLCLDLLHCRTIGDAGAFLRNHPFRYNPFAVVIADRSEAMVAYNSAEKIMTRDLSRGLHVFSSSAQLDPNSAKADRAQRLFANASGGWRPACQHAADMIGTLQPVLADHLTAVTGDPSDAICVHRQNSGTVSSTIVRLHEAESRFESFYCAGAPCCNAFGRPMTLDLS